MRYMPDMNMHNLIFSGEIKYRLLRHGLFCVTIFLYSLLRIGIMFPTDHLRGLFPSFIAFTVYWTSIILIFCYTTVYFIVPKFLYKKEYTSFILAMFVFTFLLYLINSFQNYYQVNKTFSNIAGINYRNFFQIAGIIRLLGNPPLVCALLLSLKSLKNWYLKKVENENLARANTNAELQLLKSQIHPHFLFNTLNNIYSYSLNKKNEAAGLVTKLRSTVHYMVSECNHAYVPLKNELNMISNYIELEKIRYGNRLSMQIELMNPEGNHRIAPLLMIPFVENSFKHGVSQMLENPGISLQISVEGNILYFLLSNSKPLINDKPATRKGIGLENVKKRLELLYPERHVLETLVTEESYTVHMEISLTDYFLTESSIEDFSKPEKNHTFSYAT
jgi:hypothetical protein